MDKWEFLEEDDISIRVSNLIAQGWIFCGTKDLGKYQSSIRYYFKRPLQEDSKQELKTDGK